MWRDRTKAHSLFSGTFIDNHDTYQLAIVENSAYPHIMAWHIIHELREEMETHGGLMYMFGTDHALG